MGLWSISPAPTAARGDPCSPTQFLCQCGTALTCCSASRGLCCPFPRCLWFLPDPSFSLQHFLFHFAFSASVCFCFSAVPLTAQKFFWIFLKLRSLAKHFVQFGPAGWKQSFLPKKYQSFPFENGLFGWDVLSAQHPLVPSVLGSHSCSAPLCWAVNKFYHIPAVCLSLRFLSSSSC